MSFLAPLMLIGTAAAAIPVILHFFFRSRYRTVPWAAMKFLLTSIEQTSRRLKFQELLLLLARISLLVLLAIALARPISSAFSGSGQGEAVDAVFLFDTSMSMATREGGETRLARAKAAALDVIDKLPPYSTVQIVTCADRASQLGPRIPANLDQARYIIEKLQLSDLATDFLPGTREALKVLKARQLSNKELYIFSDMQKNGWEAQPSALTETLRDISQQATIYLVRCGNRTPNNVAITGITPQSGIPRPGERVGFAVMVKNTGKQPVTDLEVTLMLDGDAKKLDKRSIKSLDPGQTQAVTLSAKMTDAGMHVITAIVKHDDLEPDNRFDQVIRVRDAVRILVIDGAINREDPAKSSSYFLMHALQPVRENQKRDYHIQPTLIRPREAAPGMLEKYDLCILTNVSVKPDITHRIQHLSPEFLDDLNRFVRRGHGLMIFAGDHVTIDDYNKQFAHERKLLPFELTQIVKRKLDNPLQFNRNTANLPVYRRFREDQAFKFFNNIMAWKALAMKEPTSSARKDDGKSTKGKKGKKDKTQKMNGKDSDAVTVALRYDNGNAAIVSHKVDAGEVLLFTTSANVGWQEGNPNPTWTSLPITKFFFPLIELSINHLLHQQMQNHNTTAGATLNWFAPKKESAFSFVLYRPDGKKHRLGLPTIKGDRPMIVLDDLLQAGIYQLAALDPSKENREVGNDPVLIDDIRQGRTRVGRPFAVTPDFGESADLETLSDEQINKTLGFPVVHAKAGTDAASYSGLDRSNREWTWWVLLAVLCVTLGEGVLAWFCGRPI